MKNIWQKFHNETLKKSGQKHAKLTHQVIFNIMFIDKSTTKKNTYFFSLSIIFI